MKFIKRVKQMKRNRRKKKKHVLLIILISLLILLLGTVMFLYGDDIFVSKTELLKERMKDNYNEFVETSKKVVLYNISNEEIGLISSHVNLELDELNLDNLGMFKLKNIDAYIEYDSVTKVQKIDYDERYKNYIPFNESIVTNENTKLYEDDDKYYIINERQELPIIMKDDDRYYVSFDNKLLYINKNEAQVIENINSESLVANSLAVLNYHFVINEEAGEDKICDPISICHTDTQFDSHMNYISQNGFYTVTMKELEMFIDNKINLPQKSVAVTIDDGWFVSRAIPILEKYNVMGTLFLIGSLAPVSDYESLNLEIHSHTWDLHNVSNCKEGRSALLCYDKSTIVEDLKKSRESLNNTTYFCYPFYEYNNHAIEALKEAGFTMALTDGGKKVTRGIDKLKVPRYVVYNTTTVEGLSKMIN